VPSYGFRAQVGDGNKIDFSKSAEYAGLVITDSKRTSRRQTRSCEVVEDRWPKSRKRRWPEAGDFVVDGSTGADRQQQQRVLVVGQTHAANASVLLVLLLVLLDLFASAICWGERQKRVNFGTDRQGVGQRERKTRGFEECLCKQDGWPEVCQTTRNDKSREEELKNSNSWQN
jgi:hypothetical protein